MESDSSNRRFGVVNARIRLAIAAVAALSVFVFMPHRVLFETRLLAAWDMGVVCFLILAYRVMTGASAEDTYRTAMRQDQSGPIILALVVTAAIASLFAIVFLLRHNRELTGAPRLVLIGFSILAIVGSWLLTHTMFALHYAHRYYGDIEAPFGEPDEGFVFPGGESPDYLDFLYCAFVIGQTAQVSDVQVISQRMRRLVLVHSILSFWFYTGILALMISIVAGLI